MPDEKKPYVPAQPVYTFIPSGTRVQKGYYDSRDRLGHPSGVKPFESHRKDGTPVPVVTATVVNNPPPPDTCWVMLDGIEPKYELWHLSQTLVIDPPPVAVPATRTPCSCDARWNRLYKAMVEAEAGNHEYSLALRILDAITINVGQS